ncbi:hypothetical protein ACHQM5_017121 [Ranunculus cassubicifolius]
MTTGIRSRGRVASRRYRSTPYSLPSRRRAVLKKESHKKEIHQRKKLRIALEKKDWEDATCSVCMEYPHNAVLLLCSSHEKGCRPYMCGTSYRYSNCLDQFKKAYTKSASPEAMELTCPLCRGQVKGMTVVEPARECLNAKKRSCTQDDCSFTGTYKELRKHVKEEHPFARPRQVDPTHEQKWRSLEHEREREDVLSTIWATTPRARVLGDYVIEGGDHYGFDSDDDDEVDVGEDILGGPTEVGIGDPNLFNLFFMYHAFGEEGNASFQSRLRRQQRGYNTHVRFDEVEEVGFEEIGSENGRHSNGRVVGRERRRRRRSHRRTVLDHVT